MALARPLKVSKEIVRVKQDALADAPSALGEFLMQFENGDERVDAALRIVTAGLHAISEHVDDIDRSPVFYAYEVGDGRTLEQLAQYHKALSWVMDVADSVEISSTETSKL